MAAAVSTNGAHRVKVWEVKDQKPVHAFDGHSAPISVSFEQNGYHLASVDESGTVKLWDLRKLKELKLRGGWCGCFRIIRFFWEIFSRWDRD